VGDLLFAFGSLAATPGGRPGRLHGLRRCWGVAMDNREVIPGYKVWVDPATGTRPAVEVAFLDLEEAGPGTAVSGVLLPIPASALPDLDRRERNYVRAEVTDRADPCASRVWAYLGRPEARARCAEGRRRGTAVVARTYADEVRAAFAARGPAALAAYEASTAAPGMPLADLERIDVPPA
jgi:hypothetical protein